jgi:hypothetical protein
MGGNNGRSIIRGGSVGGTTGGLGGDGGGNFQGTIDNIGSLKDMQNRDLQRQVQQGISKFESRLGVRSNVLLADLQGAVGVAATDRVTGKTQVYLNRGHFEVATPADVKAYKKKSYDSGFLTRTNKPTQHTVVHELAHALWNNHRKDAKSLTAGKDIAKVYKQFLRENPKQYGSYSRKNINEFYAEVMTKGILGKSDKYSRALINISKKNKL